MTDPRLSALSQTLPGLRLLTDAADLEHYGRDWTRRWTPAPLAIALPASVEEVQAIVRWANAEGVAVVPSGGRTGLSGGAVAANGELVLSLQRMNKVLGFDGVDRLLTVQAGIALEAVHNTAKEHGLVYPVDFAARGSCSIGGNIATNAGGPRCLKYGVTRHYVLGLEAVLADGTVLRAGGRCHKNKTGFDLVGVMVGSEGMLGVVTEATLRLIPHPPMRAMLSAGFRDFATAARAVQTVLDAGFLPSALEIADKFTLRAAREHLGASVTPEGDAHLLVELDGQKDSVALEVASVTELLRGLGCVCLEEALGEEACERLWKLRREFSYSLRNTGLIKLNEDIVVPRSRLVDLVDFAERLQEESGFPVASFGHAGDGNIHVNIMVPTMEDAAVRERAEAALDKLFRQVIAWKGAITGEHGVGLAKRRWFDEAIGAGALAAHRLLKHAFDPRGILNPGKFLVPPADAAGPCFPV